MSNNNRTAEEKPPIGFFGAEPFNQIAEPELSAFRFYHARIREANACVEQAQQMLTLANGAWAAFVPVLRARYGLAETDQIDEEGRIHRGSRDEDAR